MSKSGLAYQTEEALNPLMNDISSHSKSVNRIKRLIPALAACLFVSACSVSGVTDKVSTQDQLVTNSIAKDVAPEGISTTDAETIKQVVAGAKTSDSPSLLAWSNPETGSRGTITAIDRFTGSQGQKCKKFQTTVDTFMGISLYNGETCELRKGLWVLSQLLRDDAEDS